jgi:hypothetical protein
VRPATSSMIAMPPFTLTQARTAASPLFRSGPPPSSPLYLANAASSGSSSSSACLSQQQPLRSPAAGSRERPAPVLLLLPLGERARRRLRPSAARSNGQRERSGSVLWYQERG